MSLVDDQRLVVKAINELRKQAGLGKINKLRRGIPRHQRACTLAMSVAGTGIVSGVGVALQLEGEDPKMGSAAWNIMNAFDKGELPELEMPKTPVKIRFPGDRKATVVG